MNLSERLKKAVENKRNLKITMYDNEKQIYDTDIYEFYDGRYRGCLGLGFELEEIIKEINNPMWLRIEVVE